MSSLTDSNCILVFLVAVHPRLQTMWSHSWPTGIVPVQGRKWSKYNQVLFIRIKPERYDTNSFKGKHISHNCEKKSLGHWCNAANCVLQLKFEKAPLSFENAMLFPPLLPLPLPLPLPLSLPLPQPIQCWNSGETTLQAGWEEELGKWSCIRARLFVWRVSKSAKCAHVSQDICSWL